MAELEQHVVTSACGEYKRNVWVLPGPNGKVHPLGLFLDAEHYLRDMKALTLIVDSMDRGEIPRMTLGFVSHVSGEARHHDYTGNPRYAKFIAEDVVAWMQGIWPTIRDSGNLIAGLSLSGLAAADIVLRYPETFSSALCQSGSFWWWEGRSLHLPPTQAKFWMSVGDEETAHGISHPPTGLHQSISQISGVEAASKRLNALGGTVHFHIYSGGHAIAPWREELIPALTWLTN